MKIINFTKFINEANLSTSELIKYSYRPELFIKKYIEGMEFELKTGTFVKLDTKSKNSQYNIETIKKSIQDETQLNWNDFKFETVDGDTLKITDFKKSSDFGGKSGAKDPGKQNEFLFYKVLNEYLKVEPSINITITDKTTKLNYKDITSVENSSLHSNKLNKADITLISTKEKIGLSLKQDDAGYYESADTIFKAILNDIVSKIKDGTIKDVTLTKVTEGDKKGNWLIKPEVAVEVPQNLLKRVVFGLEPTIIIKRTFKENDFTFEGKNVTINCSKIFRDLEDLNENEKPIIIIRNNTNRNLSNENLRGLRIAVVTKKSRPGAKLIDYKVKI